jgi:hypothetical protein
LELGDGTGRRQRRPGTDLDSPLHSFLDMYLRQVENLSDSTGYLLANSEDL